MKSVLVVDDDKSITELVRDMLESSGHRCTMANSGPECVNLIRDKKFDLVLLDIAMPEVSGIDVVKKMQEDDAFGQTRIVFFTASYLTEQEKENLKKLGVLDCLSKPFTEAKLLEMITKYAN